MGKQLTLVSVTNFRKGSAYDIVAKLELERKACVAMPLCLAGVAERDLKNGQHMFLELQLPTRCSWEMKGRHAYNCARGNTANGSVNQSYFTRWSM